MTPPEQASEPFPPVSDHAFWEQASRPILEHVTSNNPITVIELRAWALRQGLTPAFLTHSLKWLEIRGRILRDQLAGDRPAWRVKRAPSPPSPPHLSVAKAPSDTPAEMRSEIHAKRTPEGRHSADASVRTDKEDDAPPVEWISTKEAANLLDMSTGGVLSAAKRGRMTAMKEGNGRRAPYLLDRASVLAFRRAQLENDDGRSHGSTLAAKRARRVIDAVGVDGAASDPPATLRQVPRMLVGDATLRRRLLLLAECGLEGLFDPGEALTKIRTLLSEPG
jgi:hypothetical protein